MFEEIPKNCRYAYARVSSKSQEDNSSLESQKQEFRKLAVPEKNIRIEIGSAADPIRERPIFQKLIEEELQEKEIRKQARANRKRLPKREPMTGEIYKELIQAAEGPTYIHVRTRVALCILAVTGIRINELLPLKVNQLQTLIEEN